MALPPARLQGHTSSARSCWALPGPSTWLSSHPPPPPRLPAAQRSAGGHGWGSTVGPGVNELVGAGQSRGSRPAPDDLTAPGEGVGVGGDTAVEVRSDAGQLSQPSGCWERGLEATLGEWREQAPLAVASPKFRGNF